MLKVNRPTQRIGFYPDANEPQPPRRQPPRRRKLPPQAIIRLLMMGVCLCVFITCSVLLIRYFSSIAASRKASRELEAVYSAALEQTAEPAVSPTAEPKQAPAVTAKPKATAAPAVRSTPAPSAAELWPSTYAKNPTLRISSVFYELQRQNKDIIGWLKIDGVVEEPVLQRDNSYYLTHNALGQRSVTGALFLDETCELKKVPTQMVIHGHNMKEGAMFGSLKKYKVKDASYYRDHPFIDFNTIYENGRYVIFAVCEVDIRAGRTDYLPFWHDVRFSSANAFEEYVSDARALSHYRCNVDVSPGDRLLTLSTCTGTDDNKRLLVMARKLRDDENELELKISILSTSDR